MLYSKTEFEGWGAAHSVIAYFDLEERQEHIVPNIGFGCQGGSAPKWAPNGYHIAYHESSCIPGPPWGILRMTDQNGSFDETLASSGSFHPDHFIFSHDGASILISYKGLYDSMELPATFSILTFARPVPEVSPIILLILTAAIIAAVVVISRSFTVGSKS